MADRIKGSNLPFINLSKENLRLIYDALEAEQAGKMIFALTEYIYDGIEPNFETKIEKSVWNNILMLIDRKAESYFKKATANRENGKKGGRPKKNNDITPNEEIDNTLTTGLPKNTEEQHTDTKEEIQQQTIDSSVTFDNYSKDLNDLLDENEQRINGWVNAITNGIVCKSNITEFPKEMAIKNIEKIITDLGTDTKDALDFKEYMTEIITDSIRRKRYERAVQSSYNS